MPDKTKAETPAVKPPIGTDKNWGQKIAIAQAARKQAQEMRAGKPSSFRSAVGRS
ncbi:MAG: hypothetical protein ACRDWT_00820 [Jatrophihabitantaceae bacterium]